MPKTRRCCAKSLLASLNQLFGHVDTAQDGTEALMLCEHDDFDILITDISMPQMDGIELIRRIRTRENAPRTIVNLYPVFTAIGVHLNSLAREIRLNQEIFFNRFVTILESFNFTLITYRQNVWEKESENPNFYDPSIISDIDMLINLLRETEADDGGIEFF